MRHVAPHRWADAAAGRVPDDERARMDAHAAGCARCAAARDRVRSARGAFAEIAGASPPELKWEQIGARIYWASSQERQARRRATSELPAWRRRWRTLVMVPALAAAAASVAVLVASQSDDADEGGARATAPAPAVAPTAPIAPIGPVELVEVPAPAPIVGLVTLAEGEVALAGAGGPAADARRVAFDTPVVAGAALETGAGRIAIQLDAGTAFALGPSSRLAIARLDTATIELHVDGEVSVEVTRRAPGQRFAVVAGGRVVEVRGTAFEVARRGDRLAVTCLHGVVAVRDAADPGAADAIEVAAGRRWEAADADPLTAFPPSPLDDAALAELAARAPARLPAWTAPGPLLRTTGPVEVIAPPGRAVRIDGEPVGAGALTVRVMSGRHLVEVERAPGRFAAGEWVAIRDGAPARVEAEAADEDPAAARRAAVAVRRKQLDRGLDRGRLAACVQHLAKQGMAAGTHVDLEIGVDATGALRFLNVGDTELSSRTAACVRDAAAAVRFPAGPAATWRHRVSF